MKSSSLFYTAVLCGTLGLASYACKPAAAPVDTRVLARSAVNDVKAAWIFAASACEQSALITGDEAKANSVLAQCAEYLVPAHELILDAAGAVDTEWGSKSACKLAQAGQLVAKAVKDVGVSSPIVDDAVAMIGAVLGSSVCQPVDATPAEGGSPDAGTADEVPAPSAAKVGVDL